MNGRSDELPSVPESIRVRLARPTIRLSGPVGHPMVASFFDQLLAILEVEGSILIELFTDGDAEIGQRLAKNSGCAPRARQRYLVSGQDPGRLGRGQRDAAFPRDKRWLTRDAALLIHGRRMVKDLRLEGPLGSCRRVLKEMVADIDHGLRLEEQGFAELSTAQTWTPKKLRLEQRPCRGSRLASARPISSRTPF